MDSKYGRIFTEGDVEKVLEHLHQTSALSSPPPDLANILDAMDENETRFKFPKGEPLFVLRGRDKRAVGAIRFYGDHQSPRAPMNHLQGIEDAQDAFDKYRRDHPNEMKEPD